MTDSNEPPAVGKSIPAWKSYSIFFACAALVLLGSWFVLGRVSVAREMVWEKRAEQLRTEIQEQLPRGTRQSVVESWLTAHDIEPHTWVENGITHVGGIVTDRDRPGVWIEVHFDFNERGELISSKVVVRHDYL